MQRAHSRAPLNKCKEKYEENGEDLDLLLFRPVHSFATELQHSKFMITEFNRRVFQNTLKTQLQSIVTQDNDKYVVLLRS